MILATEQELKILLNRIKFLEEELEKTKKSLIATKDPTQISPHQKQINHLMEVVNEIAGYDIRQKKSRAIECVIPRYAFIRLAYDMYPNKQFVVNNLIRLSFAFLRASFFINSLWANIELRLYSLKMIL